MSATKRERVAAVILGKPGYGKSHLVKTYIIPQLVKSRKPVFILDCLNEYQDHSDVTVSGSALPRFLHDAAEKGVDLSGRRVRVLVDSEESARFGMLAIRIWARPASIIIEEADRYGNPSKMSPVLSDWVNYGRHWGADIVMIARRAASINRSMTAAADVIISFCQHETRDIEALRGYTDAAEMLRTLPKRDFLTIAADSDRLGPLVPGTVCTVQTGRIKKRKTK